MGMIAARGLLRGLLPLIMAASVSDAQRTGSEPDTTIERVLRPARLPEREGVEGMAGLRARVVTRDSTGTRFRLDGIVLRADSTRFELRCQSNMVPSLPGSSPITSGTAPQACDGAATTVLWKDVQQLHVRRARAGQSLGRYNMVPTGRSRADCSAPRWAPAEPCCSIWLSRASKIRAEMSVRGSTGRTCDSARSPSAVSAR